MHHHVLSTQTQFYNKLGSRLSRRFLFKYSVLLFYIRRKRAWYADRSKMLLRNRKVHRPPLKILEILYMLILSSLQHFRLPVASCMTYSKQDFYGFLLFSCGLHVLRPLLALIPSQYTCYVKRNIVFSFLTQVFPYTMKIMTPVHVYILVSL